MCVVCSDSMYVTGHYMVNAWLIGDCMTTGIKSTYNLCCGEIGTLVLFIYSASISLFSITLLNKGQKVKSGRGHFWFITKSINS